VIRKGLAAGWSENQPEDCGVCGSVWMEGEPLALGCPNGHFVHPECCVVTVKFVPICPICAE
jgi:hypothetical protein